MDEVGQRKGGWDWFTTLTFRDRTPAEQAAGWTKVGWAYSKTACNKFLGHLGELKGLLEVLFNSMRSGDTLLVDKEKEGYKVKLLGERE